MKIENILQRNFTRISDKYRKFALAKDKCRQCSIYNEYKQVGQSEGNALDPTFFFYGEALGKDEVEQVRPFIGLAGQRFRAELRKHKHVFTKKNTIISNLLSCRPKNNKFPRPSDGHEYFMPANLLKSKDPYAPYVVSNALSVVKNCMSHWVGKEIKLLRPKIIIALGATALDYMMDEGGITANRGKWVFLNQWRAWGFATFHPSYVLRCERRNDSHVVQQFEDDIKKLANSWHFVVTNDKRLKLSDDEWKKQAALDNFTKKKKLSITSSSSSKSNWSKLIDSYGGLAMASFDTKKADQVITDEFLKKYTKLDAKPYDDPFAEEPPF